MLSLTPQSLEGLSVLCIGAHCDDIEIGCGGLLQQLASCSGIIKLRCEIFSGDDTRESETRDAMAALTGSLSSVDINVHRFRDGHFPSEIAQIKAVFERLKSEFEADLILTHYRDDLHQDHNSLSDLTWNTFRNHWILEYEVHKYDGDIGQPNVYLELSPEEAERKAQIVFDSFNSQRDKLWMNAENIKALMRIRSVECAASSGFAEAFYSRKLTLRV